MAFYATDKEWVPEVKYALQEFASALPNDIRQEGVYRGSDSLNPTGVYEPNGPKDATHYWTAQTAEFGIFPAEDKEIGVPGTELNLAICTIDQGQSFDLYFNGELVLTKQLTPEESLRWLSFPVKVTWRPGRETSSNWWATALRSSGRPTPGRCSSPRWTRAGSSTPDGDGGGAARGRASLQD